MRKLILGIVEINFQTQDGATPARSVTSANFSVSVNVSCDQKHGVSNQIFHILDCALWTHFLVPWSFLNKVRYIQSNQPCLLSRWNLQSFWNFVTQNTSRKGVLLFVRHCMPPIHSFTFPWIKGIKLITKLFNLSFDNVYHMINILIPPKVSSLHTQSQLSNKAMENYLGGK